MAEGVQAVLAITGLPESGLDASAAFHHEHLARVEECLAQGDLAALVLALAPAGPDHDDWRRALARDLARAHKPVRVNVVAGDEGEARDAIIAFLETAPGVTGQYLVAHE
ncbi:Rossmann fold domain-containing protein [Qipengyuania nanhaisediminis]|uniref:Rossmann fold domain-containing protein n=1 Tax=Qipengyuania nanhaisediminis TaxID=604088 RepID=UPI0038B35AA0